MESSIEQPGEPLDQPAPRALNRMRWVVHLLILASYPLALQLVGRLGLLPESPGQTTLIPKDPIILLQTISIQFFVFMLVFVAAWAVSRATPEQLMLPWRNGVAPLWRGALYSVGLRVFLFVVVLLFVLVALVVSQGDTSSLSKLRPQTERLVDPQTLADNPLYLLLNATVVSFVFAGFREELWRAGMMAALLALFPRLAQTWGGKTMVVLITAILFGLGHLPQGWGGVVLTGILGLGLGAIMLYHRSIWDAVIAHGFFDATTFVAVYLLAPIWDQITGAK